MITSKEIMSKTLISRATLNNYIKMGIIPRGDVKSAGGTLGSTKKIGYFPEKVIERIEIVQRMKKEGASMVDIERKFRDLPFEDQFYKRDDPFKEKIPEPDFCNPAPLPLDEVKSSSGKVPSLTMGNILFPAFLLNKNFEIEWSNEKAESEILNCNLNDQPESYPKSLFRIFFNWEFHEYASNWKEIIAFYIRFVKSGIDKSGLIHLCPNLSVGELGLLEKIYDEQEPFPDCGFLHNKLNFHKKMDDGIQCYDIYTVSFMEGLLFIYVKSGDISPDFQGVFSGKHEIASVLVKQKEPSVAALCALGGYVWSCMNRR